MMHSMVEVTLNALTSIHGKQKTNVISLETCHAYFSNYTL